MERHPLFGHKPAKRRFKARRSFLREVEPSGAANTKVTLWEERLANLPQTTSMSRGVKEELPPGADLSRMEWKCLNRLRSGTGRCKPTLKKWGYLDNEDVTRVCGSEPETMEHLLRCPRLGHKCDTEDLSVFNDRAKNCVQFWLNHI